MLEQLVLRDEKGNEFTGVEVLALTLDSDFKSLKAGSRIIVIQNEDFKLYPFLKKDNDEVELIEDEDILDSIEEMLEMILTEQISEKESNKE